jgi:hypothetical protein
MTLADAGLTTAGWIFMLSSLACVIAAVVFCFSRVLRTPPQSPPALDAAPTEEKTD